MIRLKGNKAIEPLHNYVFVKVDDEYVNPYLNRESEGGLIIGGAPSHLSQETGEMEQSEMGIVWGTVEAVGKGCTSLKVGDEVYYVRQAARVIPVLGGGYRMISEQNIQSRIFDVE